MATGTQPRKHRTPDIWLSPDEEQGTADCGCRLTADHRGGGPALFYCPKHAAAPDLLDALDTARIALNSPEADSYRKAALAEVLAAITKAEPQTTENQTNADNHEKTLDRGRA